MKIKWIAKGVYECNGDIFIRANSRKNATEKYVSHKLLKLQCSVGCKINSLIRRVENGQEIC